MPPRDLARQRRDAGARRGSSCRPRSPEGGPPSGPSHTSRYCCFTSSVSQPKPSGPAFIKVKKGHSRGSRPAPEQAFGIRPDEESSCRRWLAAARGWTQFAQEGAGVRRIDDGQPADLRCGSCVGVAPGDGAAPVVRHQRSRWCRPLRPRPAAAMSWTRWAGRRPPRPARCFSRSRAGWAPRSDSRRSPARRSGPAVVPDERRFGEAVQEHQHGPAAGCRWHGSSG
jgi:hypothetical protein